MRRNPGYDQDETGAQKSPSGKCRSPAMVKGGSRRIVRRALRTFTSPWQATGPAMVKNGICRIALARDNCCARPSPGQATGRNRRTRCVFRASEFLGSCNTYAVPEIHSRNHCQLHSPRAHQAIPSRVIRPIRLFRTACTPTPRRTLSPLPVPPEPPWIVSPMDGYGPGGNEVNGAASQQMNVVKRPYARWQHFDVLRYPEPSQIPVLTIATSECDPAGQFRYVRLSAAPVSAPKIGTARCSGTH